MASTPSITGLIGAIMVAAPATFWIIEGIAALGFLPHYDYIEYMISDLGVPYVMTGLYADEVSSPLSSLMNFNFVLAGCLYCFPQLLLLFVTQGGGSMDRFLRSARAINCVSFFIGLALIATFHGGPLDHENGNAALHAVGALLAILGGNVGSVLAGASTNQMDPVKASLFYRLGCIGLGIFGIAFGFAGPHTPLPLHGLIERLAVYPVFVWELFTGIYLLGASQQDQAKTKTI